MVSQSSLDHKLFVIRVKYPSTEHLVCPTVLNDNETSSVKLTMTPTGNVCDGGQIFILANAVVGMHRQDSLLKVVIEVIVDHGQQSIWTMKERTILAHGLPSRTIKFT